MTESEKIKKQWHEQSDYNITTEYTVMVTCSPIKTRIVIGEYDDVLKNKQACYEVLDFLMCHILEE